MHAQRHPPAAVFLALFACGEKETIPEDHLPAGVGRWETRAPANTPGSESGLALARGQVVAVGGFHAGIEVYDPAADRWRTASPFSAAIDHVGAATWPGGERILIAGFYSAGLGARAETFAFDPQGDTFEPKAPLLRAVGAGALVALDETRLALVGGNDGSAVADLQIYDTATDTWSAGPPMPTPRDHLSAAVIGDALYAIGGRNSGSFILSTVEIFDLRTNTWSAGPELKVARSGHATAVARGRIYVFGGEGAPNPPYEKGTFPEVEEFDPQTNTWRFVAPMPTPRHGIQAVAIDDEIYVPLGGDVQGAGTLPLLEVFIIPET